MTPKPLALSLLFAAGLFGQTPATVESIPFRAILSSGNETSQPANPVSGTATVWLHLVEDRSDPNNIKVLSGSADAVVNYNSTAAITLTAMHIHKGLDFVNGPVVVPFALARTDVNGKGVLPTAQTNFPSSSVSLDTINGILADPSQYYFNVHSTDAPGGVMRGQLQRAETALRIGLMNSLNETPANPGQPWSAAGTVMMLITRDGANNPSSAYAIFDVAYRGFTADDMFSGLHIHAGAALAAGPVVINSGLSGHVAAGADGSGVLHYENEIDLNASGAADAVNGFVSNPGRYYINLHTMANPGGAVRGQMRTTDRIEFQVSPVPGQEVPPVTIAAQAPSVVTVYSVRDAVGAIAAAAVVFDENPQFPAGTQFTGTHIHNGEAGQNGPVTVDSRLRTSPILTSDGTGNIWRLVTISDTTGLATLNSLIVTPWKHYLNLHTSANPGGAVRAQVVPAATNPPAIGGMVSAVAYSAQSAMAPGSNFVLTGTNLAFAASDVSGFTPLPALPKSLNGVSMTIGGVAAPLASVAPNQITGQVPFEAAPGQRAVIVTNAAGTSAIYTATISPSAPGILYGPQGVVATRLSDGSAVTPSKPAASGETVVVTAIGLGQTNPPLTTGSFVTGNSSVINADIFARIGGVSTQVPSVTALPGTPGQYRVTVVVPQGVASGNAPMMLQTGLVTSNVVSIPIK